MFYSNGNCLSRRSCCKNYFSSPCFPYCGNKCEFIRPSITNGNSIPGCCALLMAVQFLLPTLTCYEKSGNFPRKTSVQKTTLVQKPKAETFFTYPPKYHVKVANDMTLLLQYSSEEKKSVLPILPLVSLFPFLVTFL